MPDKSAFDACFGRAPFSALFFDENGALLCRNAAAEGCGSPEALLRDLPEGLKRALAQGSGSLPEDSVPPGFSASAFRLGGGVACLLFPRRRAEHTTFSGQEYYFSAVREGAFENSLALTALERLVDTDSPEAEALFAKIRRGQYACLRDARNLALFSAWLEGEVRASPAFCDVASVTEALCEAASAVSDRTVPIRCEGCGTPLVTMLDCALFERALLNLISNALLYTRDSNVVTVSLRDLGSRFTVTVSDRGAGMVAENLAAAKQPFFSAEPAGDSSARPGLGLGLAVAELCCRLQGGSLTLTSEFGSGTTAALSLPKQAGDGALRRKASQYTSDMFSTLYVELCGCCDLPR